MFYIKRRILQFKIFVRYCDKTVLKSKFLYLEKRIHKPSLYSVVILISIIVGFNFFNDAVQNENFETHFTDISDIEIIHIRPTSSFFKYEYANFSNYFKTTDSSITTIISESSLDYKSVSRFGIIYYYSAFLPVPNYETLDYSQVIDEVQFKKVCNATNLVNVLFDQNFYNGDRFQEYFKIISGVSPSSESDILIDYSLALKLNLSVGNVYNLTLLFGFFMPSPYYGSPPIYRYLDFDFTNVNISGIYLPEEKHFSLRQVDFWYSYTYSDYLEKKEYHEGDHIIDTPAIFGFHNFSTTNQFNVAQNLLRNITHDPYYYDPIYGAELEISARSGYFIEYRRESIDILNLNTAINQLDVEIGKLSKINIFGTSIVNILSTNLHEFQRQISNTRGNFLILNIPIVISSLIFGSVFRSSIDNNIMREIYLLCIKGIPKKKLITTIRLNSLLTGCLTIFLGFLGSFVSFFGFSWLLGENFRNETTTFLLPFVSWYSVGTSALFGIILSYILYLPIIRKIKKMTFSSLNTSLNSPFTYSADFADKIDVINDDLISYIDNEPKKNLVERFTCFIAKLFPHFQRSSHKPITSSNPTSLSTTDNKPEKKTHVFSVPVILICVGLIPLFLILMLYMNSKMALPDNFRDVTAYLIHINHRLQLITIAGMLCVSTGITILLYLEKPKWIFKLIKKVARVFLKEYDEFVCLETLGKKKWVLISIVFSWFCSLLIVLNILARSSNFNFSIYGVTEYMPLISQIQYGTGEFYYVAQKFLIVVCILFIFLIVTAACQVQKENFIFNNSLLLRGIQKKTILKVAIFQISVVFITGILIGTFWGLTYSFAIRWLSYGKMTGIFLPIKDFISILPLSGDYFSIFTILIIWFFIILCLFLFQIRKTIVFERFSEIGCRIQIYG